MNEEQARAAAEAVAKITTSILGQLNRMNETLEELLETQQARAQFQEKANEDMKTMLAEFGKSLQPQPIIIPPHLTDEPPKMTDERFNELLAGPLSHPMPMLMLNRMAMALRVAVDASPLAAMALEAHCKERQERDDKTQ